MTDLLEKHWQSQVIGIAKQYGWTCFTAGKNQPTARGHRQTVTAGWPDIVALGHSRALFLELKAEKGRIRPEQVTTLRKLSEAGCEVGLLRPSDLPLVLAVLGPQQLRLHRLPEVA